MKCAGCTREIGADEQSVTTADGPAHVPCVRRYSLHYNDLTQWALGQAAKEREAKSQRIPVGPSHAPHCGVTRGEPCDCNIGPNGMDPRQIRAIECPCCGEESPYHTPACAVGRAERNVGLAEEVAMSDAKHSRNVVTIDAAEFAALQRVNSAARELLDALAAVTVKENELRFARKQWNRLYSAAAKKES